MRIFGLIGRSLTHSFSKSYFDKKFNSEAIVDAEYHLFELDQISELSNLIIGLPELRGFNVTIPYKESIIPYLDEMDEVSKAVGAVNTVSVQGGRLIGYNTDVYGFQRALAPFLKLHHRRALVLGTGGASKAVAYVLSSMGIQFLHVSRTPEGPQQVGYVDLNANALRDFPLIVNTTPVGTFPEVDECPDIPYESITADNLLVDLVYNPPETLFLKKGKECDALVVNGMPMLVAQADKAWQIWNKG
jgi:shikimate dehydrogenase